MDCQVCLVKVQRLLTRSQNHIKTFETKNLFGKHSFETFPTTKQQKLFGKQSVEKFPWKNKNLFGKHSVEKFPWKNKNLLENIPLKNFHKNSTFPGPKISWGQKLNLTLGWKSQPSQISGVKIPDPSKTKTAPFPFLFFKGESPTKQEEKI